MELSCACACGTAIQMPRAALSAPRLSDGCLLTDDGFRLYRSQGNPMYTIGDGVFRAKRTSQSTGDADADYQLNRAIKIAAQILEVNPAFSFYDPDRFLGEDESWGMNAFAHWATILTGTLRVVGFGLARFRTELFGHDETGTTVMCIIAHEFGHVVQMNVGYINDIDHGVPTGKEINADFLAGYYLGIRKIAVPSLQFEKAEDAFGRLGSTRPDRTHGNPEERVRATYAGFRAGYDERLSLVDAVRRGWQYIGYRPQG
jgi:hypothetical protein